MTKPIKWKHFETIDSASSLPFYQENPKKSHFENLRSLRLLCYDHCRSLEPENIEEDLSYLTLKGRVFFILFVFIVLLVSWYFEPSQPLGIISGVCLFNGKPILHKFWSWPNFLSSINIKMSNALEIRNFLFKCVINNGENDQQLIITSLSDALCCNLCRLCSFPPPSQKCSRLPDIIFGRATGEFMASNALISLSKSKLIRSQPNRPLTQSISKFWTSITVSCVCCATKVLAAV